MSVTSMGRRPAQAWTPGRAARAADRPGPDRTFVTSWQLCARSRG